MHDRDSSGKFFEIVINVLGYRAEGEWVALALEMDLRGYGETFEEAMADLEELVDMQVSFALQKGQPDMIWKQAEAEWVALWAQVRRDRFMDLLASKAVSESDDYRVGAMPPPHVVAGLTEFSRVDA